MSGPRAATPASLPVKFFELIEAIFPYRIEALLTDNGSEFKRHFAEALERYTLTHSHTYPKTPKMNAHCERVNRTIQDEFASYHENLLFTDLPAFDLKLLGWLDWYNRERPHFTLTEFVPQRQTPKLLSPLQFLIKRHQCNMDWPDTCTWRNTGCTDIMRKRCVTPRSGATAVTSLESFQFRRLLCG